MSEKQEIIAFQGERGAYSEAAAVKFFGDTIEPLPCESFEVVFDRVTSGKADKGIVPVENSLAGSIHRNYDLLLRYKLTIVGEVQLRIAHQLMVLPGVKISDIRTIYSHPQALAQCEQSITEHFPTVQRTSTYDTAGSAKMLREKNIRDGAAIASARAAKIYNMDILHPDLEDNPENFTRFLVIAREPVIPTGESKTSIVFSMPNAPGALFKSMAVFALRDIDLTKIESRPLQGERWQYFFYLDFVGSQHESRGENALNNLREIAGYLRVLGSYPRGV